MSESKNSTSEKREKQFLSTLITSKNTTSPPKKGCSSFPDYKIKLFQQKQKISSYLATKLNLKLHKCHSEPPIIQNGL